MRASTKILLSIATFFAGAGIILFAIVMAYNNWDFKKLNTAGYYEKTVEADGQFQNISIDSDTADIRFEASGDNTCKVYAKLQEHYDLSAAADGSTLTIRVEDNTTWLDRFGLNIGSSEITVYLPEKEYLALTVDASTGDVTVPSGFSFDDVDIVCSTGDVTCSAAISKGLKIRTSTGSILAENASPESVELTTSDLNFSTTSDASLSIPLCLYASTLKKVLRARSLRYVFKSMDCSLAANALRIPSHHSHTRTASSVPSNQPYLSATRFR